LLALCRLDTDLVSIGPQGLTQPLLEEAARQRLIPLLHHQLRRSVSTHGFALLRETAERITHRALRMTLDLRRSVDALTSGGVEHLLYKGPALGVVAFGNAVLRHYDDLDIVVRAEDRLVALEALREVGFSPDPNVPAPLQDPADPRNAEITLTHPDGTSQLDLHWRLHTGALYVRDELEALWSRRQPVTVAGDVAQTFSPADYVVLGSIEAAKDGWSRLDWMCCLDRLLRRPDVDGADVLRTATTMHARRATLLGCHLAARYLATPLPPELSCPPADRRRLETSIEGVRRRLDGDRAATPLWTVYLGLADGPLDAARMILRPSPADTLAMPLPAAWSFLHLLARPGRLVGRFAARGSRPSR
jgi:hypothetical protein